MGYVSNSTANKNNRVPYTSFFSKMDHKKHYSGAELHAGSKKRTVCRFSCHQYNIMHTDAKALASRDEKDAYVIG